MQSGPLDLLALDQQGRWVVIEIKRGNVDERTVLQVIDYAACLRELSATEFRSKLEPYCSAHGVDLDALVERRGGSDVFDPEQRNLVLVVVGTGKGGSLERMVRFLSDPYEIPISAVVLQIFELADGRKLLTREITEQETPAVDDGSGPARSVEAVLRLAAEYGTRAQFEQAIDLADKKHWPVRPFKTCLMVAPPTNATWCLFTLWAKRERGELKAYVALEGFTRFFSVEREEVERKLGPDGWRTFADNSFAAFLQTLVELDLS